MSSQSEIRPTYRCGRHSDLVRAWSGLLHEVSVSPPSLTRPLSDSLLRRGVPYPLLVILHPVAPAADLYDAGVMQQPMK